MRRHPAPLFPLIPIIPLFAIIVLLLGAAAPSHAADGFALAERARVVVLGDSITADGTYAQLMQDLVDARFPERQIRFIPAGAAGDTVRGSFARLESWVVPWRPDWVLINLGVNDLGRFTTEQYLANYEAMINRIARDTGARVAIMSFIHFDKDAQPDKERGYLDGLKALAAKYGCLYIPCNERFEAIRPALPKGVHYANDGIHPNLIGDWVFAQAILEAFGYPFTGAHVALRFPLSRLMMADDDAHALLGARFTVATPDPLDVEVTPIDPPSTIAKKAAKPLVIDGKLDDWDLSAPIVFGLPEQRIMGVTSWTRDRHAAKAWTCWNDAGWYLAVAVDTPVVLARPTLPCDAVELFLDARPASERAKILWTLWNGKDAGVCQYVLTPAGPDHDKAEIAKGSGHAGMMEGATLASSLTDTGYILELMIPAARFPGGKLTAGERYGLDIGVDDVDRLASWTDLVGLRWSRSPLSFFSTIDYGTMTLAP